MSIRRNLFLAGLAFVILSAVAMFQQSPGYMDADYYYVTGVELSSGGGFWDYFLWNYLSDPTGIPVPSHTYWMPLSSMLVAIGIRLFGDSFFAARILIIAVAASLPIVTGRLAYVLGQSSSRAFIAGLLAVFSGYYLVFLPVSDAFGLYMLLGGIFFLLVYKRSTNPQLLDPLLLGLVVGLLHLARADGILWLPIGAWVLMKTSRGAGLWSREFLQSLLLFVVGYAVLMAPWFWRNWNYYGAFFAPGGSKALWLTNYDELFSFPASRLNFTNWAQSGFGEILSARLWAAGQNLQTLLAVQGGIILLPLIIIGAWNYRKTIMVQGAVLYWILLFLLMTLALPFPGVRGSFFHSGSALQPLLWALVPAGLDRLINWGRAKRGWKEAQARPVFTAGLITIIAAVSFLLTASSLGFPEGPGWGETFFRYQAVGEHLQTIDPGSSGPVMINNPPGYSLATSQPAIVIPGGAIESTLAAARKYEAGYLVLEPEKNFPEIYSGEEQVDWLQLLAEIDGLKIYRILDEGRSDR